MYGNLDSSMSCNRRRRSSSWRTVARLIPSFTGADLVHVADDPLYSFTDDVLRSFVGVSNTLTDAKPLLTPDAKQELSASEGADGSGTQGTVTSAGGIMKEADSMVDELVRLRAWRKDMENT